jgi:hypothetical protein
VQRVSRIKVNRTELRLGIKIPKCWNFSIGYKTLFSFSISSVNTQKSEEGGGFVCLIYYFCQDFKKAGISRLLNEKGREQFWPKNGNLCRTRKNL